MNQIWRVRNIMSIKYGERIVLFGAGDFGHQAARLLRFEKDILYIVDNDLSISGGANRRHRDFFA